MLAGVIGLGHIGHGVARSLVRAGHGVRVFDVRPEAMTGFPPEAVASSPAEVAAESDVVVVAVVDDEQLRAVLTGPDGVLSRARPGSAVVVVSTVSVSTVEELAKTAATHDVCLLDAGVTGGTGAADRGTLVTMVGGSDAAVAQVQPVLDGFSSLVVHMGPLGAGMKAKLARNLVVYSSWLVHFQAQSLAEAAGIELSKLRTVIEAGDREIGAGLPPFLSRPTTGPADYDGDALAARMAIAHLAHKDLAAAVELGQSLGVDLPVAELADHYVEAAMGLGTAAVRP
jgi:3-hydroxyisobutyrate dehydrogenase